MNKKGFTLIELLATLVILSIVVTIGGVAITRTISNSKEKNYQVLVKNIKSAVETYYHECNYGGGSISCSDTLSLKDLVTYGFISSNGAGGTLINPKNDENISSCKIRYTYIATSNSIIVSDVSGNENCPKNADYNN